MTGMITVAFLYPFKKQDRMVDVEFGVTTVADVIHAVGKRVPRGRIRRWYLQQWYLGGKVCTPKRVIGRRDRILFHVPVIIAGPCGRCRAQSCLARKRSRR